MKIGVVYPYYFKKGAQVFQERLSGISPDISFKKIVVPDRENLLSGARLLEDCDVIVLFEIFDEEDELEQFEKELISFYSFFKGLVFRCFVLDEDEIDKFCEFFTNFYFYPEKLEEKGQKKSFNFL